MKKLFSMFVATVMLLGCFGSAGAEPEWNEIGAGQNSVLVLVKVMERYVYGYKVKTNEENLLDALEGIGLVQGDRTSQGYDIDKVDGYKGRPEENGAYWMLQTYNDEAERFQMASGNIADIGTEDYTAVAFVRNTDDVPYEEKLIYMVVDAGDEGMQAFEILTENQNTVLECLLDNGLVGGKQESWGFNVTEAAGVKADYERDGSYFNILAYNDSTENFEYMDRSLASITIDELPSIPEMAGYAFVLTK